LPSMFPSDESYNKGEVSCGGAQEDFMVLDRDIGVENISGSTTQPSGDTEHEINSENMENNGAPAGDDKAAGQMEAVSNGSASVEGVKGDSKVEVSLYPLERCMRILPHDQNTGAFFIAVLQKVFPLQGNSFSLFCKIIRDCVCY